MSQLLPPVVTHEPSGLGHAGGVAVGVAALDKGEAYSEVLLGESGPLLLVVPTSRVTVVATEKETLTEELSLLELETEDEELLATEEDEELPAAEVDEELPGEDDDETL